MITANQLRALQAVKDARGRWATSDSRMRSSMYQLEAKGLIERARLGPSSSMFGLRITDAGRAALACPRSDARAS